MGAVLLVWVFDLPGCDGGWGVGSYLEGFEIGFLDAVLMVSETCVHPGAIMNSSTVMNNSKGLVATIG